MVQLVIDWLVISAACGCILAFFAYRTEAQASKDGLLPPTKDGDLQPLPLELNRLDDRVYGGGASAAEAWQPADNLPLRKVVRADGAATQTTFTFSGAQGARKWQPLARSRSWPRHASRTRVTRPPSAPA